MLTDRFDRALLYATHIHGGQVRKGTSTPYVAHLLAVAATVLEYGGDEDLAIAALLHDSVEDQGGKARLTDVRNRFASASRASSRPAPTVSPIRRRANERRTGRIGRKITSHICSEPTKTSCASHWPTKFTMRERSCATFAKKRSAKKSGTDSASPKSGRSGTIAASPISSARCCPANSPRSSARS